MKQYDAYVINLDKSVDRWNHIQAEFKGTLLNVKRFSATEDSLGRGWVGVGKSYGEVVKDYMKNDPDFNKGLLIVLEDDAFRIQTVDVFNKRCQEIFTYLENNRDKYSHFQGGGIYPSVKDIESQNPLLIRCDWITCATFTIINKAAAETILKYQEVPDDKKEPIDNYLAANNRGNMIVPYPHLCWQLLGIPSTISNAEQKVTLNEGFRASHKTLSDFVKGKVDCKIYEGGGKKSESILKRYNRLLKLRFSKKRFTKKKKINVS